MKSPFNIRYLRIIRFKFFWNKRPVMLLKGLAAQELLKKLGKSEGKDIQLVLAKATGNFKRGNERASKKKR